MVDQNGPKVVPCYGGTAGGTTSVALVELLGKAIVAENNSKVAVSYG